ncbi:MAG: hypothetical protein U5K00_19425 [Melioribacteraceae bacterium]|nr:hypothetical protein [Melioribacteraceae bacterium]
MEIKKLIIEALEDQKAIFGDDLYQQLKIPEPEEKYVEKVQESSIKSPKEEKEEPVMTKNLFQEEFEKRNL